MNRYVSLLFSSVILALIFTLSGRNAEASSMHVNGVNGDYAAFHYYIDESQGQSDTTFIEFWPSEGTVTQVELWSNLNKRDLATLTPDPPEAVNVGEANHYFCAYTMSNEGNGRYTRTLPIEKCGTYRITCRYKVAGDPNWRWYSGRNTAVVVSDTAVRDMVVYEAQVNVVDATGDDYYGRSHFDSLHDGSRFNLDYIKSLGVNTLWLMPIHPTGSRNDGNYGNPGSPYSIKNMWQVGEHLGSAGNRADSMYDFQQFMSAAESAGVNVIFDTIFNHTSKDAEIERSPENPAFTYNPTGAEIRNVKPNWYSKYTGSGSCFWNDDRGGSPPYQYWAPADHSGQVGPAPADRHDFGKWCDTIDLYFGTYSALGNPKNEDDGLWVPSAEVKKLTEYFAYFAEYWLTQTSYALDGFRCDFAQGLPPQAWEYMINRAKSLKPELMFLAESLDGGEVTYRANRHFDMLNDDWIWGVLGKGTTTTGLRGIIDQRKAAYGFASILRGLINHDQSPPANKWYTCSRYAIGCAVDGAPQMFMGQELGYTDHYGFSKWRLDYGRWLPDIRNYANMGALWNDAAPDHGALWNAYSHVNKARQASVALRLANQYYLNLIGFAGVHESIFSVMKYTDFGRDAAQQEVVLCFINLQPGTPHYGTFFINAPPVFLNLAKNYNVKNLASATPDAYLWAQPRTGSDLANNGLYVSFATDVGAPGAVAQFLKLEEAGSVAPPAKTNLWVGNSASFPAAGALDSWEDLWIDTQTWPIAPGQAVTIGYKSSQDNIWHTRSAGWNYNDEVNSRWHLNLGRFPKGSTITYYVQADNGWKTVYDSNSGANYAISVSPTDPPVNPDEQPLWVGNDTYFPNPPTDQQDLVIQVDSAPIAPNQFAEVVFCFGNCANSGNWSGDQMSWVRNTATHSIWQYNLGKLAAGTSVEWNMVVKGGGAEVWAYAPLGVRRVSGLETTPPWTGENAAARGGGIIIVPGNDLDQDGIPNDVEVLWGLNPTNAADAMLNLDGDPIPNLHEYLAGTDGSDSNLYLSVDASVLSAEGATVHRLSWVAMPSVTYQLQIAREVNQIYSNVTSKSTIGLSPYTMTVDEVDSNEAGRTYYRLKVE
jgi:hypothetical protein